MEEEEEGGEEERDCDQLESINKKLDHEILEGGK